MKGGGKEMENTRVTLVVVPRERFSCARRSLESIFKHTKMPFNLIYIDGNSPKSVRHYLESEACSKKFDLIRTESYLSPNVSRNIGLTHVQTEYLVFIDNDVVVSEGWLEDLLKCAEETNAAVVTPLICQGEPVHEFVHCTGGEARIITDDTGKRMLRERLYNQGKRVADLQP